MRRFLWALVVGSIAMAGGSSAQANLLTNGNFDDAPAVGAPGYQQFNAGSTAITGWKVASGSVDVVTNAHWQVATSPNSIDLSGNGAGRLEQTVINLSPGTYVLNFVFAGNANGGALIKAFDVFADAVLLGSLTFDTTGKSNSNMGWTAVTPIEFTVAGSSVTIAFQSNNNDKYGAAIDNVSLELLAPFPAPEPTSLALAGLGALGLVVARRKKAVA